MKTLLFLFLSLSAVAQCETDRTAQPYYAIPSFLSLYLSGQCISQNLSDTTICTRVNLTDQPQLAAFSYSTPTGSPVYVTSVKQYNQSCGLLMEGTQVMEGEGYITVCYQIQTGLVDNFCPYTLFMGGLAVKWGTFYAYYSDALHVRFTTESNAGTNHYEILQSDDCVSWTKISECEPKQETSSFLSDYNVTIQWAKGGINYFRIVEVDVNGKKSFSEFFYCEIPYPSSNEFSTFDIIGRQTSKKQFEYIKK